MYRASSVTVPVVIVTFAGIAAGEYPGLTMNRATIAMVSAVLLVALQVLSPAAALSAIDPATLLLVFAMMIISANLRLAGFFGWVGQVIAQRARSPRWLLAWIIVTAGVLSAFFLNDTVVIVFTPLRSKTVQGPGRNRRAAVEALMRCLKHPFGGQHGKLPVRGLIRVSLVMAAAALMINVRRIWRYGSPPPVTPGAEPEHPKARPTGDENLPDAQLRAFFFGMLTHLRLLLGVAGRCPAWN
jgi:hypothetical protein